MANRYAIRSILTTQEAGRFWLKVRVGDPLDCWIWESTIMKKGYGGFSITRDGKSRILAASRVAYTLHYGHDPEELDVLHTCDNPRCCNPLHLFLGTNNDNIQDRVSKGRSPKGDKHWSRQRPDKTSKGENHGLAKLSDSQARDILRRALSGKESYASIAASYAVCEETVRKIAKRQTWRHL